MEGSTSPSWVSWWKRRMRMRMRGTYNTSHISGSHTVNAKGAGEQGWEREQTTSNAGVGWRWLLGWNQKVVSVWSYCGKIFPWADFQWRNSSFSSNIIFMHTQEIPFSFISFSFLVFVPSFFFLFYPMYHLPHHCSSLGHKEELPTWWVCTPRSVLWSALSVATHLCLSRSFSILFHLSMIFYIVLHLSTSAHLPDL